MFQKKLMKKALIIITIMCIFVFNSVSQAKKHMEKIDNFEISITSKYFGRKDKIITINTDKVIFEKNKAINIKEYSKGEKEINKEIKQQIINFLIENPIESFKSSYFNSKVKDGTVISFSLKVNDSQKDIFVANYYIKELGELVKIVNSIVPNGYLISYRQDCCRETILK